MKITTTILMYPALFSKNNFSFHTSVICDLDKIYVFGNHQEFPRLRKER